MIVNDCRSFLRKRKSNDSKNTKGDFNKNKNNFKTNNNQPKNQELLVSRQKYDIKSINKKFADSIILDENMDNNIIIEEESSISISRIEVSYNSSSSKFYDDDDKYLINISCLSKKLKLVENGFEKEIKIVNKDNQNIKRNSTETTQSNIPGITNSVTLFAKTKAILDTPEKGSLSFLKRIKNQSPLKKKFHDPNKLKIAKEVDLTCGGILHSSCSLNNISTKKTDSNNNCLNKLIAYSHNRKKDSNSINYSLNLNKNKKNSRKNSISCGCTIF